ncbi:MAG: TetR/AcrR family transcriptional regulator C-terminal domain-containing protein [Steroidobacter sp.]
MLEPLGRPPTETSFETQLLEFANRVADAYSFSHLRGLYRIALTDAVRHTGTGRIFYQRGPGLLTAELARFIHGAQRAGVIRNADSRQLASHFMALLRAGLDLADTFPSDMSNRPPRKKGDVSRAMNLFYAGIRAGERDASTDLWNTGAGL